MILTVLSVLFFLSLPVGQLGAFMFRPGLVMYVHDMVLAMLLFSSLIIKEKHPVQYRPLLLHPILFFSLAAVLSILVNIGNFAAGDLFFSALYLVRWVFYAAIYLLVVRSDKNPLFWLRSLYISGFLVAALGLIQYVTYPTLKNLYYQGWDEHYYRLFSTFFDPNFAGAFLALTFLLGMYLIQSVKRRQPYIFSQFILLVAILLTYSRSTFLSFVVAVLFWFIALRKSLLGIFTACTLVLIFAVLPTWGRDVLSILRPQSAAARLGNWRQSFLLFTERPVIGFGFNTLRIVQTQRGWASDEPFPSRSASGVDSSLLFVLITTGTAGFLSYLYLLYRQILIGLTALKRTHQRTLGLCYLAVVILILVHSLFTNSLFYPWIMIWMWIFTGAAERFFNADTSRGVLPR